MQISVELIRFELQLTIILTATCCSIAGIFLVLRKMGYISEAISHAIILGIVVAFAIVRNHESPLILIGASATGLLLVFLVEMLKKTNLVKEDSAIGVVFPVLFAIGIILISKYFTTTHLDTDSVISGDIIVVPVDRMSILGISIPRGIISILIVLALNITYLLLFYKELKLSTFDPGLAIALGFSPALINYSLMGIVSITAVQSFEIVGTILVVGFLIIPPATAYLLSEKLSKLILLSVIIGIIMGLSGYWLARILNSSISACSAIMGGIIFFLVFLFSPKKGYITKYFMKKKQKLNFMTVTLLVHLYDHENTPIQYRESNINDIHNHLNKTVEEMQKIIKNALKKKLIKEQNETLFLTVKGRDFAKKQLGKAQFLKIVKTS